MKGDCLREPVIPYEWIIETSLQENQANEAANRVSAECGSRFTTSWIIWLPG